MNPLEDPPEAPVFWTPQDDTSIVVLLPPPDILAHESGRLPADPRAERQIDHQGAHSLFDLGNAQRQQLVNVAPMGEDASLVAVVPLGQAGFDRLEAVARLLAAIHGRVVPADRRLTRQQRLRARRMLQAYDGARAGATQQEIAQVIFQTGELTRDEWQASSTRHAVMALLRDARAMIAGRYRKLLRHRHRSKP